MWTRALVSGSLFCVMVVVAGCGGTTEVKTAAEPDPETVTVYATEQTGTEPSATEETTTEEAEEESPPAGAAAVGDTITLHGTEGDLEMRVKLVEVIDPAPYEQYMGPSNGKRFVAVKLRLTNTGDAVYSDSPSNGATVIDRKDQGYESTIFSTAGCPDLGSPTIRPGDRRVGCITFEVPKQAKLRTFQFALDSGFGPETGEWQF
jgi:Domain of unknown function (DUF4352)